MAEEVPDLCGRLRDSLEEARMRRATKPALDLEAIGACANKATGGPWDADAWYIVGQVDGGRPGGEVIAQARYTIPRVDRKQHRADAEFIAAARTDVPDLIAEVRRLRGVVERVESLDLRCQVYDRWSPVDCLTAKVNPNGFLCDHCKTRAALDGAS